MVVLNVPHTSGLTYIHSLAEECFNPCKGDIRQIKYFTAKADDHLGRPGSRTRQATYIKALRAYLPTFKVQYGHHIKDKTVRGYPTDPAYPPNTLIEIKTSEEKGSDVNLAVNVVSDAYKDQLDTAIIISNDGDLRAAVVEAKGLGKTVIVLIPWRPGRIVSKPLTTTAHDFFLIEEKHLAASQLPNPVPSGTGRGIYKPNRW